MTEFFEVSFVDGRYFAALQHNMCSVSWRPHFKRTANQVRFGWRGVEIRAGKRFV